MLYLQHGGGEDEVHHRRRLDVEEDLALRSVRAGRLGGGRDRLGKDGKKAFDKLSKELDQLLDSQVACPGDGNVDGVVNQEDIKQLSYWAKVTGKLSSWYDFNLDGLTNKKDVPFITNGKFPRNCPK